MSAVAIDFETANARRDSACAVGLAWVEDGAVVRRETRLIRPPTLHFDPGNIRIHGILPGDVRNAPSCAEALEEFLPDLTSRLVLAHNAGFDMGVLAASLAACGRPAPDLSYLCTVRIARRVFPDPAGCGLAAVAARLGIRFAHHDAGEDAFACAEIALAAMRALEVDRLDALGPLLGLVPGRLTARPQPGPTATSALAALRGSRPADRELRFVMRGRTGNRYDIVLEERTGLYLRCACLAGRNRLRCRHVEALLDGEIGDLLSGNHAEVELLRQRIVDFGGAIRPPRVERRAPVTGPRGSGTGRWSFG